MHAHVNALNNLITLFRVCVPSCSDKHSPCFLICWITAEFRLLSCIRLVWLHMYRLVHRGPIKSSELLHQAHVNATTGGVHVCMCNIIVYYAIIVSLYRLDTV